MCKLLCCQRPVGPPTHCLHHHHQPLQSKDLFARECATSRCFKVPSKTAAAPAASKQPAAAAEAGGKRAAAGEGEAAAGGEAVAATSDAAAKGGEAAAEAKPATAAGAAAAGAAGAAAVAAGSGGSAVRNVDYREFLNLCHNWQKVRWGRRAGSRAPCQLHRQRTAQPAQPVPPTPHPSPLTPTQKLTEEVFSTCLQSGDYMQAKNALLCLNRCVKVRGQGALGRGCTWKACRTGRGHPPVCGGLGSAGPTRLTARSPLLQVYPATKVDAARLIEILAPIR